MRWNLRGPIRALGAAAIFVFGLLSFRNYQTLSFSPIAGPGPSGLLMIFFGLCAAGGVGLLFLKSWGRWFVGAGALFVIGSQFAAAYLFSHGHGSMGLITLFEGTTLARLAQPLHILVPVIWALRVFYLAAFLVMIFWSRWTQFREGP